MKLWERLLLGNLWPNRKDADTPEMAQTFVERFVKFPYSSCEKAVERIIDDEEFFPPWSAVKKTIEAEWKSTAKLRRVK